MILLKKNSILEFKKFANMLLIALKQFQAKGQFFFNKSHFYRFFPTCSIFFPKKYSYFFRKLPILINRIFYFFYFFNIIN